MESNPTLQVYCAWCGVLICFKDGKGVTGVSHGICEECADRIFKKATVKQGAKD